MTSALATIPQQQPRSLLPTAADLQGVKEMAKIATTSGLAKVDDEVRAAFIILRGMELGAQPFTSLDGIFIAVSWNAKRQKEELSLGLTVSFMMGLCESSGQLEDIAMPDPAKITDSATVTVKRKGRSPFTYTFTKEMATSQKLLDKGNWQRMYQIMMLNRAISGALRPVFADVLKGMYLYEEISPENTVDENSAPLEMPDFKSQPSLPASNTTEQHGNSEEPTPSDKKNKKTEVPWWEYVNPESKDKVKGLQIMLHWCRDNLSLSDAEIIRLANVKALDDVSKESGWGQYESGAVAYKTILANQQAEMDAGKSDDKPKDDPKPPKTNPGKDAWTDFDEHSLWELAHEYMLPERQDVFAILEVDTLRDFGTPAEVRAKFTSMAIEGKNRLMVQRLSYHGNFTNLYCGDLILRAYGRDHFRGIEGGEINKECENWQKGKMYSIQDGTLTDALCVMQGKWSAPKKEDADYFEVEKGGITLYDIPF